MMNGDNSFKNYDFSSGIPFYRMYKNNMVGQQHFFFSFWFGGDNSRTTGARQTKFSMDTEHTHT